MAGKFEIKKAKNGEFYFHLKAGNGQNILSSEMYKDKASAENGIASVKKNASDDSRYERKDTKNGQFMFNLKAANHQVIGTSETYTTTAARDAGIASVKENAPQATLQDETT
ncbi:MAG: YegP family protein [Acidobacteriaceae bacterium]